MSIQVKCFASLREYLGEDSVAVAYQPGMTIAAVWESICAQAPPPNLLCARNYEYADFHNCVLADGDEVAFFPPVTGG